MAQALKDASLRFGQLLIFTVVIGLLLHVPVNGIIAVWQDAQYDILSQVVITTFLGLFTIAAVNMMSDIIYQFDDSRLYSKIAMAIIIAAYSLWSIFT